MTRRDVYFWTIYTNPYNSIFIQRRLVSEILLKHFDVNICFLDPDTNEICKKLKDISNKKELIFWEYGSYDRYIKYVRDNPNLVIVYHNFTPPRFFIRTNLVQSLKLVVVYMQVMRYRKKHWITVSKFNKQELYKFGVKDCRLCPNVLTAVSKIKFRKNNEPTVIYIGRIIENKNCIELLDKVARTSETLKMRMTFYIVGNTRKGSKYAARYEQKIASLQKHPYLTIHQFHNIAADNMVELIQKSWIYVSASLHEGFGIPACDAVANGIPALYYECGGQESTLNGKGMVRLKEKNSYHVRLAELLSDPLIRSELQIEQMKEIRSYYSPYIDEIVIKTYGSFVK